MTAVIINADDFGMSESCTKAIVECFEKGLVTDTTMLANGVYFDEAVKLAKLHGFDDKIGIHLNLTEGEPLTEDIKGCPRFVTDGRFNKSYDRALPLSAEEQDAIYKELTAQAVKLEKAGLSITHADSHHHIHTGVWIAPIASRVCREHGIEKIRMIRNLGGRRVSSADEVRYKEQLKEYGLISTRYFTYMSDIQGMDIPDSTEILVHPDYDEHGSLIDRKGKEKGIPFGNPITRVSDIDDITQINYTDI